VIILPVKNYRKPANVSVINVFQSNAGKLKIILKYYFSLKIARSGLELAMDVFED
jgi:hypothetical protein